MPFQIAMLILRELWDWTHVYFRKEYRIDEGDLQLTEQNPI